MLSVTQHQLNITALWRLESRNKRRVLPGAACDVDRDCAHKVVTATHMRKCVECSWVRHR
jgi:hypothetical protein